MEKEKWILGFLILQVGILLVLGYQVYVLKGQLQGLNLDGAAVGALPKEADQPLAKVSLDDDPQMGENKAKVTIVEFSDFECPYCAKFHQQTFPQIKKDYIDTGKVRFIYRDFPLPFHNHAQKAAEASECADEQGKYWEYHNLLFENYDSLSVENLKKFAVDLKLDTAKFNSCLDSGKMSSEVSKDSQEGQGYGVSGTPAFFVNGKLLTGAQPFAVFQQAIEAELGK